MTHQAYLIASYSGAIGLLLLSTVLFIYEKKALKQRLQFVSRAKGQS